MIWQKSQRWYANDKAWEILHGKTKYICLWWFYTYIYLTAWTDFMDFSIRRYGKTWTNFLAHPIYVYMNVYTYVYIHIHTYIRTIHTHTHIYIYNFSITSYRKIQMNFLASPIYVFKKMYIYGNPLQYSYLGNPMDRGVLQATAHGVANSRRQLSN